MPDNVDFKALAEQLGLSGTPRGEEMYVKCPFHSDRNPSFAFNVRNGLWICQRGCGQGDFTRLVMRMLGVGTLEAETWISSSGRKVSLESVHSQLEALLSTTRGHNALAPIQEYWRQRFEASSFSVMPTWLFDRGFNWESVQRWGLRWDDSEQAVLIPVQDHNGALIGTITRNLTGGKPKYQNSPLMGKANTLFGLFLQRRGGVIIVVEGPLDCIWLDQLGFPAAALLGSRMSAEQARLLQVSGYNEVVLALDNDPAGEEGTPIAEAQLVQAGYLPSQIKLAQLPSGKKDLQDCDERLVGEVLSVRQMILLAA